MIPQLTPKERYQHYNEPTFVNLLDRLAYANPKSPRDMVDYLVRIKHDQRGYWIAYDIVNRDGMNNAYPQRHCLDALLTLGIYTCGPCDGNQWPKLPKANATCKQCFGTGWYHAIDLLPGSGFTVGYCPGMTHANDAAARFYASTGAIETFKIIFPKLGNTDDADQPT